MMRAIDLFAGAGGTSLGLRDSGYDVIAAVEWDRDAAATYRRMIDDHVIETDIATLDMTTLPDCDLLTASPPCQSFSMAGKRDPNDPRSLLWREVIRAVEAKRPAWVVIENVPGMTTTGAHLLIVDALQALGYAVDWRVLNTADYGVPQTRKRLFFIANRLGLVNTFPEPTHAKRVKGQTDLFLLPWVSLGEALGITGPDAERVSPTMMTRDCGPVWSDGTRKADYIPNASPSKTIRAGTHGMPGYSPKHQGGYVLTSRTDHGVAVLDEPSCAIKAGGNTDANGHMGGACPPVLPYVPLDDPSPTILGGSGGKHSGGAEPIRHRLRTTAEATYRRLTTRECATLQGFPDWYEFAGSMTSQYRQIGNAVPPPMAKAIAEAIHGVMES